MQRQRGKVDEEALCSLAFYRMRAAVAECDRSLASRQQSGATKLRLFSSEFHRKGTCTVISASLEAAASSISITTSPSIAHGGRWRGSKKEEKGWNRIEGLKGRME